MVLPDRISKLIASIEAGETVTQRDVNRVAALQALDLAKLGEDFAREAIQADQQLTDEFRQAAQA